MSRAHKRRIRISIFFRGEYSIRDETKIFDGEFCPSRRIVVMQWHIRRMSHRRVGMYLSKPLYPSLSRNPLILERANNDGEMLALRGGCIDQILMPSMWRIEFTDDESTLIHMMLRRFLRGPLATT